MPRTKVVAYAVVGPYCDRCGKAIVGPAIEVGLHERCVACLLRPNVLVNYAIRQLRERAQVSSESKRGGVACGLP